MHACCAVGPQFRRLTPDLEEAPPPREIACPCYRACLAAAAAANLALDCSRCPEEAVDSTPPPPDRRVTACA